MPDPSNADQVRAAIEVTTQLLRATAASTAADEASVATTIDETAAALEAEAEAAGYSPAWIRSPEGNQTLAAPEFTAAYEAYQQRTEELCLPDASGGDEPTTTVAATDAPS